MQWHGISRALWVFSERVLSDCDWSHWKLEGTQLSSHPGRGDKVLIGSIYLCVPSNKQNKKKLKKSPYLILVGGNENTKFLNAKKLNKNIKCILLSCIKWKKQIQYSIYKMYYTLPWIIQIVYADPPFYILFYLISNISI